MGLSSEAPQPAGRDSRRKKTLDRPPGKPDLQRLDADPLVIPGDDESDHEWTIRHMRRFKTRDLMAEEEEDMSPKKTRESRASSESRGEQARKDRDNSGNLPKSPLGERSGRKSE